MVALERPLSGKGDERVMDLWCFPCTLGRLGSLGSQVTAKIGLLDWVWLATFLMALSLGIALALLIDASIMLLL